VRTPLTFLAALLFLTGANFAAPIARAEAPGDFAASMGLTASDGSVRTQASVRVALAPAGAIDFAARMRGPVQTQMSAIRRCFSEAMVRSSAVEGRAVFELEAAAKGKTRAATARDETGDPVMVECMRSALNETQLTGLPVGAKSLVTLVLTKPAAQVRADMERRARVVDVRMLDGGRAETNGATQQGEVQFALRGSAYATDTISVLHQRFANRLAGLLDCRRKASRRNRPAEGTVSLQVEVRDGEVAKVTTANNGVGDRGAPQCVTSWLKRGEQLASAGTANLTLDITFSR
jgi:hypothetical protein